MYIQRNHYTKFHQNTFHEGQINKKYAKKRCVAFYPGSSFQTGMRAKIISISIVAQLVPGAFFSQAFANNKSRLHAAVIKTESPRIFQAL